MIQTKMKKELIIFGICMVVLISGCSQYTENAELFCEEFYDSLIEINEKEGFFSCKEEEGGIVRYTLATISSTSKEEDEVIEDSRIIKWSNCKGEMEGMDGEDNYINGFLSEPYGYLFFEQLEKECDLWLEDGEGNEISRWR